MIHHFATRPARPARLAAAALALSLLGFLAPIGPGRPLAASATVSPPACTTETILTAPYANCKLGYGGASLTLGPATLNEATGYMEGRFTTIIPSKASMCPECTTGSIGITERTYVPGGATASAGGPVGLSLGLTIDPPVPDLTVGGSFSGKYVYKEVGGAEKAVFIRSQVGYGGPGLTSVTAAGDAILIVGTPLPTPTCTTGTNVIGAAPGLATVKVTPCAGNPTTVTGYKASAYVGASTTPKTIDTSGVYGEFDFLQNLPSGRPIRFTTRAKGAGGFGPESAKSAPAILPFTSVSGFVNQTWTDFAFRVPAGVEATSWTTPLTNDTKTGQQLIGENVGTPAWDTRAPIIRLFRAYFLRTPDLAGLDYWVNKNRNGTSLNAISSSFATSSEFTNRYGALTNGQFVNLVYQNVLGRPGDAGGVASWTGKLDRKIKTRGQVMIGFSESNEYKNKSRALVKVVTMYVAMLRRVPTQAQIDANLATSPAALADTLMKDGWYDRRFNTVAYPAILSTSPLPGATKGKAYATTLSRYGGPPPVVWRIVTGVLPDGLSLSSAGVISGTPTKAGTFSFTVQLADVRTRPINKAMQLTVSG